MESLALYPELAGPSAAMQQVRHTIERAAACTTPVLIIGEAGTGHEVVASAIHTCGPRRNGPFVTVPCAAIRPEWTDPELFGGPGGRPGEDPKPGLVPSADGGTLFLAHVLDLPDSTQPLLLALLDRGELPAMAGRQRADVRLIAGAYCGAPIPPGGVQEELFRLQRGIITEAERSPWTMVNGTPTYSDNAPRRSVLKRLSEIVISLPPLRQRAGDIPAMVDQMVAFAAQRFELPIPRCRGAVVDRLMAYDWPGNLRELKNTIERAVIFAGAESRTIEASDVLAHIGRRRSGA